MKNLGRDDKMGINKQEVSMSIPKILIGLSVGISSLFPIGPVVAQLSDWIIIDDFPAWVDSFRLEEKSGDDGYIFRYRRSRKTDSREIIQKSSEILLHSDYIGYINCSSNQFYIGVKQLIKTDGSITTFSKTNSSPSLFSGSPAYHEIEPIFKFACKK